MSDLIRSTIDRRAFLARTATAIAGLGFAGGFRPGAAFANVRNGSEDDFPEPEFIETNGIKMAVYHKGEGIPVVFSHGFPELGYSWRYQLNALADAGFHAIVPDQRGYGLTDRPEAIEDYDIHHLTGDLVGLLDHFGYEKAVFCGHDWGGAVVWNMGVLHPDRTAGIIGVNTAYFPRAPMEPIEMLTRMRGEGNYVVWFQEPGVADDYFMNDVEKVFRVFMRRRGITAEEFNKLPADAPERNFDMRLMLDVDPATLPGELLMSEDELQYYVDTFTRTGFTGGMNWYRNITRNWETTEGVSPRLDMPCLYVGAEDDVVLPPSMMQASAHLIDDLEQHIIEDCGHWTQQEKPEELNTILIGWLTKRFKNA